MTKFHTQHVEYHVEKTPSSQVARHSLGSSGSFGHSDSGFSSDGTYGLSHPHRDYLLRRHGTLELDPIPQMNDADPYNWPTWKKVCNLCLVATQAMLATFNASAIQSAFEDIALDFHTTIQRTSYLTSLFIVIIGVAPLFWRPLADRYGRRPVFILSMFCSLIGNMGCAYSPSYATMALCRAITAFFICPASAIGSAVVTETFFRNDRARYMGIWTLMVIVGIPLAPFLMGFVAFRVGYRYIYFILAGATGVNLLLYLVLGPETRYMRSESNSADKAPTLTSRHSAASTFKREYWNLFSRIDPTPLCWQDFVRPLGMITKPSVAVSALAHSVVFVFAIFISIEIPQLFGSIFHLNTEQVGLQYLALMIGSVVGEQIGGVTSDRWMLRRQKKLNGSRPPHEHRLWLSYPGFVLAMVGIVIFLVQIGTASTSASHAATPPKWNITPLLGAAIMYAGNQLVTTTLITYAVDCYRDDAGSVGVFITVFRQTLGFLGPFWFPAMTGGVGLRASAGVCVAAIFAAAVLPVVLVQIFGKRWRR